MQPLQFTLPPEVEEHYVRSLAEQDNVSAALRGVMQLTERAPAALPLPKLPKIGKETVIGAMLSRMAWTQKYQKPGELAGDMAQQWARKGHYRGAMSAGILATILTKENKHWTAIAEIVLERNELETYQDAIHQHRAVQGRILAYDALLEVVLVTNTTAPIVNLLNALMSTTQQTKCMAIRAKIHFETSLLLWVVNVNDEVLKEALLKSSELEITAEAQAALRTINPVSADQLFDSGLAALNMAIETNRNKSNLLDKLDLTLVSSYLTLLGHVDRAFALCLQYGRDDLQEGFETWTLVAMLCQLVAGFKNENIESVWYVWGRVSNSNLGSVMRLTIMSSMAIPPYSSEPSYKSVSAEILKALVVSFIDSDHRDTPETKLSSNELELFVRLVQATVMWGDSEASDEAIGVIRTHASRQAQLECFFAIAAAFVYAHDARLHPLLEEIKLLLAKAPANDERTTHGRAKGAKALEEAKWQVSVQKVPDDELKALTTALLVENDPIALETLLTIAPIQIMVGILQEILSDNTPNELAASLIEEENLSEGFKQRVDELIPRYVASRNAVFDAARKLLLELIKNNSLENSDADLSRIVHTLFGADHFDDAQLVATHIRDEQKRNRILSLLHNSEATGEALDLDKASIPGQELLGAVNELSDAYDTIIDLATNGKYAEAAAVARQIESKQDRLELLRGIAHQMARSGSKEAEVLFNESIQLARASSSSITTKLTGYSVRQLVKAAAAPLTINSVEQQLNTTMTVPSRHRDPVLCSVVDNLLTEDRIRDAEKVLSYIKVDPWLREAQIKLIEALVSKGEHTRAHEYVQNSLGRINRFAALCAYAGAIGSTQPETADARLNEARQLIPRFQRTLHHAWATRTWAIALAKLKHSQAQTAIDEAIETTVSVTDMLTRFEGMCELLDVLLLLNDPRAVGVYKQILSIFDEAYYPKSNWLFQPTGEQLWLSAAIAIPAWEINACLHLARILSKHGQTTDAATMIDRAQAYQKRLPPRTYDYSFEINAVAADPQKLKGHIVSLGAHTLPDVFYIVDRLSETYDRLEVGLAINVKADVLRLFRWVGHDLTQISTLLGNITH